MVFRVLKVCAALAALCVVALVAGVCWFYFTIVKPDSGPLIGAAWRSDVAEIDRLIEAGKDVNGREKWGWERQNLGRSPLTAAVQVANEATITRLIRAGAEVNRRDGFGFTAACYAGLRGDAGIIRLLAAEGADFTLESDGSTPLEYATSAGHAGAVEEIRKILETQQEGKRADVPAE